MPVRADDRQSFNSFEQPPGYIANSRIGWKQSVWMIEHGQIPVVN
jgi:hypothetical protein